jgi:hypothetical protein
MATVEDLYRQVLGREPDAEGLAFWQSAFGGSVDSAEQASFMKAAQGELANRSVEEQATLAPNLTTTSSTPSVVAKITDQILSQGTADKWTGEGKGSAQANAADMAKIIAATGVTDINQFGQVPVTQKVEVIQQKYNGQNVATYQNEDGTTRQVYFKPTGKLDEDGNPTAEQVLLPQGAKVETVYGIPDGNDGYTQVDTSKIKTVNGQLVVDTGQTTFGNKVTGQAVANTYSERQTGNAFGGTFTGKGNTGYRVETAPDGTPIFYTTGASSSDADQWMPIVQLALAATGAGGLLGNALLGAGANQIAAGVLGGSILGGGVSALTGQDILKGALTGGIGGGIAGYFSPSTGQITETAVSADSVPFTQADYSLATGTQFNPLTDMGGAQGLQAGTSANLPSMGGGQGFTFNAGAPVTTLAELTNAINTMNGSYNPANLDAMGGGQGLTYQTPTGLVTQGGVIPTGGMTGNNNVIGETGINTAYNVGGDLGKTLAAVDTGVYNPSGGMLSSTVTGFNPDGTPTTKAPTGSVLDNLTPTQIANIIAGVGGLVGGAAITGGGGTGGGVGALPTQGVPLNTQDYFNAIQQNYNRLLPAVPRDVSTPLAQWYNSTYGA